MNQLDGTALNVLCELIPKLTKLQALSLCGNPIGKGGAVELLKCLHHCKTPLKKLDLVATGVGVEDGDELAPLLANTAHLEWLGIPGDTLSSELLRTALLHNNTIQHLDMSMSPLSEENCKLLASLLQQAECTWRELNIRQCEISGEGAVHLGAALTNNHSLTELNISCNPIGAIGAAAFGGVLRNNTALTTLNMSFCGIGCEGCVKLAAGLTENTTLQTLTIWGNGVGVEGAKALSQVIEKNKTLRRLDLRCDSSLGEGVDLLLASLHGNTTLQQLILYKGYKRPADPRVKWLLQDE